MGSEGVYEPRKGNNDAITPGRGWSIISLYGTKGMPKGKNLRTSPRKITHLSAGRALKRGQTVTSHSVVCRLFARPRCGYATACPVVTAERAELGVASVSLG